MTSEQIADYKERDTQEECGCEDGWYYSWEDGISIPGPCQNCKEGFQIQHNVTEADMDELMANNQQETT